MKTTNITKNIIKWLKRKGVISKKFGYYVDEDTFRFKFPVEIEDAVRSQIGKALKEVPYMVSYNMWDEVIFYIFLNHPDLNREKLYALLSALESAEESFISIQ